MDVDKFFWRFFDIDVLKDLTTAENHGIPDSVTDLTCLRDAIGNDDFTVDFNAGLTFQSLLSVEDALDKLISQLKNKVNAILNTCNPGDALTVKASTWETKLNTVEKRRILTSALINADLRETLDANQLVVNGLFADNNSLNIKTDTTWDVKQTITNDFADAKLNVSPVLYLY